MMKNKHGTLVVDQKRLKASQDKTEKSDKRAVSKKALQQVENKLKKIEVKPHCERLCVGLLKHFNTSTSCTS